MSCFFNVILIICSSLAIIFSNLIQKNETHDFYNIIPNHYILCKIQGNILINIISTIGRISSSGLLIAYEIISGIPISK